MRLFDKSKPKKDKGKKVQQEEVKQSNVYNQLLDLKEPEPIVIDPIFSAMSAEYYTAFLKNTMLAFENSIHKTGMRSKKMGIFSEVLKKIEEESKKEDSREVNKEENKLAVLLLIMQVCMHSQDKTKFVQNIFKEKVKLEKETNNKKPFEILLECKDQSAIRLLTIWLSKLGHDPNQIQLMKAKFEKLSTLCSHYLNGQHFEIDGQKINWDNVLKKLDINNLLKGQYIKQIVTEISDQELDNSNLDIQCRSIGY